jgi:hypothetical protein
MLGGCQWHKQGSRMLKLHHLIISENNLCFGKISRSRGSKYEDEYLLG